MKKYLHMFFCILIPPLFSSEDTQSSCEFKRRHPSFYPGDPLFRLTQLEGFSSNHEQGLSEIRQLSADFEKYHPFEPSTIPIDILIPIIEKDLNMLEHVVTYARRNVMHPICNVYVVAPANPNIMAQAENLGCLFIDESTVLPIQLRDIPYFPRGQDRRGWLFQQFLKLSCDEMCASNHILVIDADTLIVRPQTFLYKNYTIFNCSDELHLPYRKIYEKLIGEKVKGPFSFVSHCTLFEKSKLKHLKQHIETIHHKQWFEAIIDLIDKNEGAGFAENETYPQFVVSYYPNEFLQLYFFNIGLNRKSYLSRFLNKELKFQNNELIKSVSFHHYL